CVLSWVAVCQAQTVRTESVAPVAANPAASGWFAPHLVAFAPDVTQRNQLFVFLHGMGGNGSGASALVRSAAELGFHAVGLTYPNDWSPFNLCSGDPNCPEAIRREILDGVDRSPLVTVPQADCIAARLRSLLAYMNGMHPDENWLQFVNGTSIAWDRIVVWGHSQGGGNAGVIARHHAVARLCTSAPAADGGPGNPAAWWSGGATPGERCFGFCHTLDALNTKVAFWNALGMGAFGQVTDVAGAVPPFGGTHMLSTSVAPAVAGQYHNSVAMDATTPKDADNLPVYKPVWQYLMVGAGGGGGGEGTVWEEVPFATVGTTAGTTTLRMDIYEANSGDGPRPVLVWIHGGGWQSGSHNQVPLMALALRDSGVTVASIGYRLSDQATFPAQLHDCKGAIRFLRANASTYGIDPDRIAVWGSSAGGHLAALLATTGGIARLEGDSGGNLGVSSRVRAGATFFGPTDLLFMEPDCDGQSIGCGPDHDVPSSPESKLLGVTAPGQGVGWLRANLGNPAPPFPELIALANDANPVTHVDTGDPPLYIAHGALDTVVPLRQGSRLRDAAAGANLPHVFLVVPDAGHGSLGTAAGDAAAAWILDRLALVEACAADLNADGFVNGVDLGQLLSAWGPCTACAADLNGDGAVNGDDLGRLLSAWGPCMS
ncbi:MAG: BPSS1187 family protein, partial [Phycisphaerales bacterium]